MSKEVVKYNEQIVISSKDLAEFYGCEVTHLRNNFNRNKERYSEGVHYFLVSNKDSCWYQFDMNKSTRNVVYVWTERGAFQHAKSLGTDQAWDVYETLVDTYFKVKEAADKEVAGKELTRLELIEMALESEKRALALEAKVKDDEHKVRFADEFQAAEGNILLRQLAKMMHVKERQLRDFLIDNKILISPYEAYARHSHRFAMKTGVHDENGKQKAHYTVTIPPPTQLWIYKKWHEHIGQKLLM